MYGRNPNQWLTLNALLQEETKVEWVRVQAELYRIYLHVVGTICRQVTKSTFKSMKIFWMSIVTVVASNLADDNHSQKDFCGQRSRLVWCRHQWNGQDSATGKWKN